MDQPTEHQLFELSDLILAVGRHMHAAKAARGAAGTPMEGAVMRFVDRNPGTTAGAAAEATKLISSNFSRAVNKLEAKGLLRRAADPDDARRVRLYPTDAAQRNLETLRNVWVELLAGVSAGEAQVQTTIDLLRRIETALLDYPQLNQSSSAN